MSSLTELRKRRQSLTSLASGQYGSPTQTLGDPEFEEKGYSAVAQVPSAYAETKVDENRRTALRHLTQYGAAMRPDEQEYFSRVATTGVEDSKQDGWFMKILGVLDTPGELARMALADLTGLDRGSEITGKDYLDSILQRDEAVKQRHETLGDYTKESRFLFEGDALLGGWGVKEGTGRKVAGIATDILLDPLNLLSFGTAGLGKKAATEGVQFAMLTAGERAAKGLAAGALDDADVLVRKLFEESAPRYEKLLETARSVADGPMSGDALIAAQKAAAKSAVDATVDNTLNGMLELVAKKQFKTLKQQYPELIKSKITPYYATGGLKVTVPFVRGGKTGDFLKAAESGGERAIAAGAKKAGGAGRIYKTNQRLTFDLGLRTDRAVTWLPRKVGEFVESHSPALKALREAVGQHTGTEKALFKAAKAGEGGIATRIDRETARFMRDVVQVDTKRQVIRASLQGLRDVAEGNERGIEIALGQMLNTGSWDNLKFVNTVDEFAEGVEVTGKQLEAAKTAFEEIRGITDDLFDIQKQFDPSLKPLASYVPRVFDPKFAKWVDHVAAVTDGVPEISKEVLDALDDETRQGLEYLSQLIGNISRKARTGNKAVDANRFLRRREVGKVVWAPEMQVGQIVEEGGGMVVIENGNAALEELFNARIGHVDDDYLNRVLRKAGDWLSERGDIAGKIPDKIVEMDLTTRMEGYLKAVEQSMVAKKWIQEAERAGLIIGRKNVIDVGRTTSKLLGNVTRGTERLIENMVDLNGEDALKLINSPRVATIISKHWEVGLSPFVQGNKKIERTLNQLRGHVEKALKRPTEVMARQEAVAKELVQQGVPEPLARSIASATADPVLNQARATLISEGLAAGEEIMAHTMQALADAGVYDAAAQVKAIKAAQAEIARHRREVQRSVRELEEGFARTFGKLKIKDTSQAFDLTATVGDSPQTALQVLAEKAAKAVDKVFKESFFELDDSGRAVIKEGLTDDLIEALDQSQTIDQRLALIGVFEKEMKIEKDMSRAAWDWLTEPFDLIELGDVVDHYEDLDDLVWVLSSKEKGFGLTIPKNVRNYLTATRQRLTAERERVMDVLGVFDETIEEVGGVRDISELDKLRVRKLDEATKDDWISERVARLVAQYPNRDVSSALQDSVDRTAEFYREVKAGTHGTGVAEFNVRPDVEKLPELLRGDEDVAKIVEWAQDVPALEGTNEALEFTNQALQQWANQGLGKKLIAASPEVTLKDGSVMKVVQAEEHLWLGVVDGTVVGWAGTAAEGEVGAFTLGTYRGKGVQSHLWDASEGDIMKQRILHPPTHTTQEGADLVKAQARRLLKKADPGGAAPTVAPSEIGSAQFYKDVYNRAHSWIQEGFYDTDIIGETKAARAAVNMDPEAVRDIITTEEQARAVLKEFLNESGYNLRDVGLKLPETMQDDAFWNEKVLELFASARTAMLGKGKGVGPDIFESRKQIFVSVQKFREAAQHQHWTEGARGLYSDGYIAPKSTIKAMLEGDVGVLAGRQREMRQIFELLGQDPAGLSFDTVNNKLWYTLKGDKALEMPTLKKVRAEVQHALRILEGPTGGKISDIPSEYLVGVFSDISQANPALLDRLSPDVRNFFENVVQQGELPPHFGELDELEKFFDQLGEVQKGLRTDAAGIRYQVAKAGDAKQIWDRFAPKLRQALEGGSVRAMRRAWELDKGKLRGVLPKNEWERLSYMVDWAEAVNSAKIPKSMMNRNLNMWRASGSWEAASKKYAKLMQIEQELIDNELSRKIGASDDIKAFLDNFAATIRSRSGTEWLYGSGSSELGWSQRKLPEGFTPHLSGEEAEAFKAELKQIRTGNKKAMELFAELASTPDRKRRLAEGILSPDATDKEVAQWVRDTKKAFDQLDWKPDYTEVGRKGWMSPQIVALAGDALDGKVTKAWVGLHLENMVTNMQALYTPLGIRMLKDNMNATLRWWKGAATVARPDFHLRNFISAAFNNQIVDVGLREYAFVNRWPAMMRRMLAQGLTPDEIFEQMPEGVDVVMRALYESGVLKGSYASTFHIDKTMAKGVFRKVGARLNPTDMDEFAPFHYGRIAMESVEDFMRAAAFVRHFDPANPESMWLARDLANAVHFDYGNLTEMERGIKKLVPFFVWTRRNIPLQIQAMIERPGIVNRYQHLMTNLNDENPDLIQNQFPASKWLNSMAAGTNLVLNEDTPFWARVIIDPDLPVADLENVFNFFDDPIGNSFEFASGMLSPLVTLPFDIADQQEYRDVLAPVGLQQILQGLNKIGFYSNVDAAGHARIPYWVRATAETAVPFGTTYQALAGIQTDPNRQARLGINTEDGADIGERIRGAALQIGRGFGVKLQTPADTPGQTFTTSEKMRQIIDDLEMQGRIPPR